jgi:hypothetical protein
LQNKVFYLSIKSLNKSHDSTANFPCLDFFIFCRASFRDP